MSDLAIELHWQRAEPAFEPGKYAAEHTVRYNNSHEVQVDAAPDWGSQRTPILNRRSLRPCPVAT